MKNGSDEGAGGEDRGEERAASGDVEGGPDRALGARGLTRAPYARPAAGLETRTSQRARPEARARPEEDVV